MLMAERNAHATGHQHQRTLCRTVEDEVATRRLRLNHRAHLGHIVQPVGGPAFGLALHADAVPGLARRIRQRVVAAHGVPIDGQHQRQVLAWCEREQLATIHRLQVERGDDVALCFLAGNAQCSRAAPAARPGGVAAVDLLFRVDQQLGERAIGLGPGGNDLVIRHLAQHLADGLQQAATHQRIVFGQHAQRRMLLDDAGQCVFQRIEPVDVAGVRQHGAGQRPRLGARGLVRLVEERLHLRVLLEQQRVEVRGDLGAPVLEQWHGGLNEGNGLG
jgi:hypothetical protein